MNDRHMELHSTESAWNQSTADGTITILLERQLAPQTSQLGGFLCFLLLVCLFGFVCIFFLGFLVCLLDLFCLFLYLSFFLGFCCLSAWFVVCFCLFSRILLLVYLICFVYFFVLSFSFSDFITCLFDLFCLFLFFIICFFFGHVVSIEVIYGFNYPGFLSIVVQIEW